MVFATEPITAGTHATLFLLVNTERTQAKRKHAGGVQASHHPVRNF